MNKVINNMLERFRGQRIDLNRLPIGAIAIEGIGIFFETPETADFYYSGRDVYPWGVFTGVHDTETGLPDEGFQEKLHAAMDAVDEIIRSR